MTAIELGSPAQASIVLALWEHCLNARGRMEFSHWVARAKGGRAPFREHAVARWLWDQVCLKHPCALACVLMPNHLHLVAPGGDPAAMGRLLSRLTRVFHPGEEIWEPVPRPEPIPDRKHLQRLIRYVLLNPCRAGLAKDPANWVWSSFRDFVGAAANPWISAEAMASALGWHHRGFVDRFRVYVASDPALGEMACAEVMAARDSRFPEHGLPRVRDACLAALREGNSDARAIRRARPLICALARHQGYRRGADLARFLGCSESAISRASRREPAPPQLHAARICLGPADAAPRFRI